MHLPKHLARVQPPSSADLEVILARQIERACRSDFYRRSLNPSSPFGLIPPTTKEDLRKGYPFGFLAVPHRDVVTYHESSGTTGTPSVSFYTANEWKELGTRFDRKPSEIVADDVFLIRIPYAFVVAGMLADTCGRQKGTMVIAGDNRTLAAPPSRAARVVKDLGVTKTWSTPTEILLIAAAMMAQGNDPARDAPSLRSIFVGGEALPPAKQRFISQTWGGAAVAQEFGCTEAGSLAGTWPDGTTRWWSDVALAEVLCDDGEIHRNGTGQLLITPLLREAMPLLRYETGDRVTLAGNDASFPWSVSTAAVPHFREASRRVPWNRPSTALSYPENSSSGGPRSTHSRSGSRLNPLRASHSASIAGQKSGTPSRKHSSAWLRSAKSRREPSLTRRFSMRRQTR